MSKIKAIGNCFIKINDSLINLKAFKSITIKTIGRGDPDGNVCGIEVTPLTPSLADVQNGVDGAAFLTLYKSGEEKIAEIDMDAIVLAIQKMEHTGLDKLKEYREQTSNDALNEEIS
jgi:hypothetical protein